jgi:alpha-mannosidase
LNHVTVRKAFEFNNPLKIVGHSSPSHGLLNTFNIHNAPNLVLDTIKRAEDDEDISVGDLPIKKGHSVILRIYDSLGGKSKGVLTWGNLRVKRVVRCSALEDEEEEVSEYREMEDGEKGVVIAVRAFEIVTVKVELEG